MMAAFEELSLTKMTVTEAALRDGVFYDLIGRSLNVDMREQTTAEFQKRYHVSLNQAKRVADTAQTFMNSLCHAKKRNRSRACPVEPIPQPRRPSA